MAILWSHADFRVSAMTVGGTAFGIVQPYAGDPDLGDARLPPELRSPRYLELRNVALRDTLATGTLVVSSGLGSTFPRGIPVGTVLRELETPEKWARTYLLRPAVPASEIHSVMVLRPDRVKAGVAEVWATAARADSAARGIVAVADSVVRDSVAAVRRREVVADSLRVAQAAAAAVAAATDSLRRAAGSQTTPAVPPTRRDSVAGRPTDSRPRVPR